MDILKHSVYLLLLTLCVAACRGCDDDVACDDPTDTACPNYDPCHGRDKPVSAAFEAGAYYPSVGLFPEASKYIVEGDTVRAGGRLKFTALDPDADAFEWTVGSDTRTWTTRSFSLFFSCDEVEGTTLAVRLVATRLRDSLCAPADVLRDTFTRLFHFVPLWELGFMNTTYEGLLDGQTTPHQVTIRFRCALLDAALCDCDNNFSDGRVGFVNLVGEGCEKLPSGFSRMGFREVYVSNASTPNENNAPWLTPDERDCDLSHFGPQYVYDIVQDLHARQYAGGDSIEIRFRHLLLTNLVGAGSTSTKDRVFKGSRVQ